MHTLIIGMTESGKTAHAKQLIAALRKAGRVCIVLDPLCDPAFNADFQTSDPVEFERVWKSSRACHCFIDESGAVGKFAESIRTAATRGRHWGHSFYFMAQKATQLEPLVRDQCGGISLFRTGLTSRKALSEDFDLIELLEPVEMLEYHRAKRSGYVGKRKITF